MSGSIFLSLPDLFHLDNTHNPLNNLVFPWKIYLSYGTNFLGWMISNRDLSVSLTYNTSVRTKSIIWGPTKMWIMGVTIEITRGKKAASLAYLVWEYFYNCLPFTINSFSLWGWIGEAGRKKWSKLNSYLMKKKWVKVDNKTQPNRIISNS